VIAIIFGRRKGGGSPFFPSGGEVGGKREERNIKSHSQFGGKRGLLTLFDCKVKEAS